MIDRHYADDSFLQYLEGQLSDMDEDRLELHMTKCHACSTLFSSYREFTAALNDPTLWQQEPMSVSSNESNTKKAVGFVQLLTLGQRTQEEGEDASQLLPLLLDSGDCEIWKIRAATTSQLRTLGIVKALCEESKTTRENKPARAFDLAVLASEIADQLSGDNYPQQTLHQIRGLAWKERANALRYLGRHNEALTDLEVASSHFSQNMVSEFDLATIDYVRATVLREIHKENEALELARKSADVFSHYGSMQRFIHARLLEGNIHFQVHNYAGAKEVWMPLLTLAREQNDLATLGMLFNNVGQCELQLSDTDSAGGYFLQAIYVFDDLHMFVDKNRTRWGLGRMLVANGRLSEGLGMLRQAQRDFESLQMRTDSALVSLEVVEVLIANQQVEEVPAICRQLIDNFTSAGLTANASTALAYLREAITTGSVTPKIVRHVRRYLEQQPLQLEQAFAPPLP